MVPTHDGVGYWLIASDGGLFAYGDAAFHGSLGSSPPPTPIVGVAPSTDGGGYWMLEANGTVHAFGDSPAVGISAASPGLAAMRSPMTGMIPDFSGQGFDAVNGSGQVFAYGDAPYFGDITTRAQRVLRPRRRHRRDPGLRPPPRRAGGTVAAGPAARDGRRRPRGRPR